MEQFSYSASFEVPDAVLDTVNSPDGDLPVITEDVLSLLAAWQRWKNQSSQTAAMSLSANLGPLVVDQSFNFYAGQFDGKQIDTPSARTAYRSIGATIRSFGRMVRQLLRRKRSLQRQASCWKSFTISARMPRSQKRSRIKRTLTPYSWMQTAWQNLLR